MLSVSNELAPSLGIDWTGAGMVVEEGGGESAAAAAAPAGIDARSISFLMVAIFSKIRLALAYCSFSTACV